MGKELLRIELDIENIKSLDKKNDEIPSETIESHKLNEVNFLKVHYSKFEIITSKVSEFHLMIFNLQESILCVLFAIPVVADMIDKKVFINPCKNYLYIFILLVFCISVIVVLVCNVKNEKRNSKISIFINELK